MNAMNDNPNRTKPKTRFSTLQSILLGLMTGLMLTACGKSDEGFTPLPPDSENSTQVSSESRLQERGCRFVRKEALVLVCDPTSKPSDEYRQIASVVEYVEASTKVLDDKVSSYQTALALLEKVAAGNNHLLGRQWRDTLVSLNMDKDIHSVSQLWDVLYLRLRRLAMDRVIIETDSDSVANESHAVTVDRSQIKVRVLKATGLSSLETTTAYLDECLEIFRKTHSNLSTENSAQVEGFQAILSRMKETLAK